jgi:hypothetical protein
MAAAVHRRPTAFRQFVADGRSRAEAVLAPVVQGMRLTGMTGGQFSLLDIVRALLSATGPADVVVSTWTTGIRDAEAAAWLLDNGAMRSFLLLTDLSFKSRQPRYCEALLRRFGREAVKVTRTHAKFALVHNADWALVCRSSMNLNTNTRFEQFDVDDDRSLLEFFLAHVDAMPVGFEDERAARKAVADFRGITVEQVDLSDDDVIAQALQGL